MENNYIDAQELLDEVKKSKKLPKATNKLGIMMMDLADHILRSPSFCRYNFAMKEDMKSFALQKMVRGIALFDESRDAKSAFNYFTRTCFNSFLTVIGKHYKQKNLKRELTMRYLQNADYIDPRNKQLLIDNLD